MFSGHKKEPGSYPGPTEEPKEEKKPPGVKKEVKEEEKSELEADKSELTEVRFEVGWPEHVDLPSFQTD